MVTTRTVLLMITTLMVWHSPVLEMGRHESCPVPVMADCQFGDCTRWKIFVTGNGSANSSIGKLRVLGLAYVHSYCLVLVSSSGN